MFKVTGMTCGHCAGTVAKAAQAAAPAAQIQVDVRKGQIVVDGPHDPDRVIAAIQAAGYGAEAAVSH